MISGVHPLPPRDARGRFSRAAPPPPPPPPGLPITLLVALGALVVTGAVGARAASWLPVPAGAAVPAGTTGELAAAAPAPPAPAPAPPRTPALPRGKGMWLHRLEWAAGGDPAALVAQAKAVGLTHLYLRLGSSKSGFYAQGDLDRLLPVAHAGGLAVVGWDFPYLFDPRADAERAAAEIAYTTPDGHLIDAFSADVETPHEGVHLTHDGATAYGARLRELVGPGYPLIATIPPPPRFAYPFDEVTGVFDAVAPMVYWMNRDPAADVARAIDNLAHYGKPILPVGQAYDGAIDGGHPGPPPRDHLDRFMQTAAGRGVAGLSFWVWHTATAEHWAAIAEARF